MKNYTISLPTFSTFDFKTKNKTTTNHLLQCTITSIKLQFITLSRIKIMQQTLELKSYYKNHVAYNFQSLIIKMSSNKVISSTLALLPHHRNKLL